MRCVWCGFVCRAQAGPQMNPYREVTVQDHEEEMWLLLDEALFRAFSDPTWAWGMAWSLVRDARTYDYERLERAAQGLLDALSHT